MSQFVTTAFVQQYTTNVQLLLQQKGSRLRDLCLSQMHVGKQAVPVEQFAATVAQRRTTRYPPMLPTDTVGDRRWVFPSDYDWSDMVDNIDKLRMLIDPQSSYSQNAGYAMGRAIDQEIVNSFFADAKTGEAGATTTSFLAADQVAATFGSGSSPSGLSIAKLKEAHRILMSNYVDMENDPLHIAITAKQHYDLLQEAQMISGDYSNSMVLESGMIKHFLGFNFVHTELLTTDSNGYRRVPVWAKSGMHLGMWQDISTNITQRYDLKGLPWQVYVYGTFGATRLEEKKVVEIKCYEA